MKNSKENILNELIGEENKEIDKEGRGLTRINGRIPAHYYSFMRTLANEKEVSFNVLLNEAIEAYILENEKPIKEARFKRARANAVLSNPGLLTMAQEDPEILTDENKLIEALKTLNDNKKL